MPSFSKLMSPPGGGFWFWEPPIDLEANVATSEGRSLTEVYVEQTWPGKPVDGEDIWEYNVSIGAPHNSLEIAFGPGPWGCDGPLVLFYGMSDLPERDQTTNDDMTVFLGDLTDPANTHSHTQPWTFGHFGLPGLPPPGPIRTGHRVVRFLTWEVILPPDHGWGVLELYLQGQMLTPVDVDEGSYPLPRGDGGAWLDAAGNEIFVWGDPPWAPASPSSFSGNHAWFDRPGGVQPPVRVWQGAVSGLIHHEVTNVPFTIIDVGQYDVFYGVESRTYTEPTVGVPPDLPDLGPSHVHVPIGPDGTSHGLDIYRDQNNTPVLSLDAASQTVIPPEIVKAVATYCWWGVESDKDGITGLGIQARFFPIDQGPTKPPENPYQPPSIDVGDGPAHAVPLSVR